MSYDRLETPVCLAGQSCATGGCTLSSLALDNFGLLVACKVGDGEANTGVPFATTKPAASI